MNITPVEQSFVIWAVGALLSIIAFIGVLGVKALINIAKDINEMKVTVMKIDTNHSNLERRVSNLEDK